MVANTKDSSMGDTPPTSPPANNDRTVKLRLMDDPASRFSPYLAPALPEHFVERDEIIRIKTQLVQRSTGMLTPIVLHGSPGMGKTLIATALAHDADILENYPDGVLWVTLGEGNDVQGAQSIWGSALGDPLSHIPDTASRSNLLRSLLSQSRMLLILDDVVDIEQVRLLHVGGPNCARIIITAKEEVAFGLKARRVDVGGLAELEALSLLTEWSGLLPDIYLPTVREIVKRLGNSPLALALVGGQARQGITWLRLLEVLRNDQGPIATLDTQDAGVRQNALGLIINLVLSRFGSSHLQQAALLGAFAAGSGAPFNADAAAACWGVTRPEAEEKLALLVEAALVYELGDGLYMIHEALRNHLRRAANPSDLARASERVYTHYLALIDGELNQPERINSELGQIMAARQATRSVNPSMSNLFSDALITTFERRGLWANLVKLATETVREANEHGNVMREQVYLADLGYALTVLGNYEGAKKRFHRSLDISRILGDPAGEASALNNIGVVHERQGRLQEAEKHYRESLVIRENLGIRADVTETLNNLAGVLYQRQVYDAAQTMYQRVLDMRTVLEDREGQAETWLHIGATYEAMGKDIEATQAYERGLAIYSNLAHDAGQAQALNNLGIVAFNQGESQRALQYFEKSQAIKERIGDKLGQSLTLNNIALLHENMGSPQKALDHYQSSYAILDKLGDPRAEVVHDNIEILRKRMQGGH
jgi:tetratricopeptide (TPR) repeat protein